jgi:hypothetical protein
MQGQQGLQKLCGGCWQEWQDGMVIDKISLKLK